MMKTFRYVVGVLAIVKLFLLSCSPNQYVLTIENDGNGITFPSGTLVVTQGDPVDLKAIPNEGLVFDCWEVVEGVPAISDLDWDTVVIELHEGNVTIRACFAPAEFRLTVNNDGNGVTRPDGEMTVGNGEMTFIEADPGYGYVFEYWEVTAGGLVIDDPTSRFTDVELTNGDATILAHFAIAEYYLTIGNDGNGTTSPKGTMTVDHGAVTSVSAIPHTYYAFDFWEDAAGAASIDDAYSVDTDISLTSGDATVLAHFRPVQYTLTLNSDANGTTSPTGEVTVSHGVPVAVAATADTGYAFYYWEVVAGTASFESSTSSVTEITVNGGAATVLAHFTEAEYSLTITNDGNGTTSPSGTVTEFFGTPVSVTAYPDTGYALDTWELVAGSADFADANAASTDVSLTGNATILARFAPIEYTLTVNNDGNGTTTPAGESTAIYGIPVSLTADPGFGYAFDVWEVVTGTAALVDAGSATTDVTLTVGNATILAHFTALAGGSISVRLTGAAEHNGAQTFFAVYAGDDPMDDLNTYLAANGGIVAGGTFQDFFATNETVPDPMFFPEGSMYQVVGIIDVDMSDGLSTGDYFLNPAKIVTVTGNMIVDVVYPDDFVLQP